MQRHRIFTLFLLSLLLALAATIPQTARAASQHESECKPGISSSHKDVKGTDPVVTYDGDTKSYFVSSHDDWQHVQIDMGCVGTFNGLRRYMTVDGQATEGERKEQGEGVSYSEDGKRWVELTAENANGWDVYVNYGARKHAWHSVNYGWSKWVQLNKPASARYIRFNWDGNRDALNEIGVDFTPPPPQGAPVNDGAMLAWAQDAENGSRRVLLRWYNGLTPDPGASYTVWRKRPAQSGGWQQIGSVGAAANAGAMANTLGPALVNQLGLDLRTDAGGAPSETGPALSVDEIYAALFSDLRAISLADHSYPVALAAGLGYLDTGVPPGETVEYYVSVAGTNAVTYGPVSIPAASPFPAPTNLRQSNVFDAIGDLGVRPSSRPHTASERYNWASVQRYAGFDGKALLTWEPSSGGQNQPTHFVAGYRIYRNGPATGNSWQLVNAQEAHQVQPQLIDDSAPGGTVASGADPLFPNDNTRYEDDLKAIFAGGSADQLYAAWGYRVCPVDLLGNEQSCSPDATIPVRELSAPAAPNDLDVTADQAHTTVTLSLNYSDTRELSPPLRVFFTRSPAATQAITTWHELAPGGIEIADPSQLTTVQFDDTSGDVGQLYWYRAQIRDNAGNWSPAGLMVNGARYPRQGPPLAGIPYDPNDCSLNPLPLELTGLDASVRQIVLYRSFSPNDPGQIIKRIVVENGAALVIDDYIPPVPRDAWYRIEAVDGHGNASDPQTYCSELDPGGAPQDPTVSIVGTEPEGDQTLYTLSVNTGSGGTATPGTPGTTIVVTVEQPGENGPESTTFQVDAETASGSVNVGVPAGATARVTVQTRTAGGVSRGTTVWLRNVNNFLDTNRHMTRIISPMAAEWAGGLPDPTIRIYFHNRFVDNPGAMEPLVAVYRQKEGGNWMQVTPVEPLNNHMTQYDFGNGLQNAWVLTDTVDPSPDEAYQYTALAFSPTSWEVLGYWAPIKLEPLWGGPVAINLNGSLGVAPRLPNCPFQRVQPEFDAIRLHNGWQIKVSEELMAATCQDPAYHPGRFYGSGALTNGSQSWPIELVDVAVQPSGTQGVVDHVGGPILLDSPGLNVTVRDAGMLDARIGRVLFLPGEANAEVTLTLPSTVKVVDPQRVERGSQVAGIFPNLAPDLSFGEVTVQTSGVCGAGDPGLHLIDENLPWRLHADSGMIFSRKGIELGGTTCTSHRMGYATPGFLSTPTPHDNNLAYLRASYGSSGAGVNAQGLYGTFETKDALSYTTSAPAGIHVSFSGAGVVVEASQIRRGGLMGADASMSYSRHGTDTSYMHELGILRSGYRRDADGNGSIPGTITCRWENMVPSGTLDVGAEGLIASGIRLTPENANGCGLPVHWTGFDAFDEGQGFLDGTLYLAAVSFADSGRTGAAMPAENAWRQLGADTGDLDPGVNLHLRGADANYHCYTEPHFNDVDMDLYVRLGGVSENLIINPGSSGGGTNSDGYRESVQRFNVLFVDNAIVEPDVLLEIYLPYPSDVRFQAQIHSFDDRNCPAAGTIPEPAPRLHHKYWNFFQTPTAVLYTGQNRPDYVKQWENRGGDLLPARILQLQGVAEVNGLSRAVNALAQTNDPAPVPLRSEWFPNGDFAGIYVEGVGDTGDGSGYHRLSGFPYALGGVRLSQYYTRAMQENDPQNLPDTLGLALESSFVQLPAKLLDGAGQLTPESLRACAQQHVIGCGFVVVDGNGAIDYFGEIERGGSSAAVSAASVNDIAGLFDDLYRGLWPVVTNSQIGDDGLASINAQALLFSQNIHWVWPVVNNLLEFDIPVRFLANSSGGAIAAVLRDVPLFPLSLAGQSLEILRTDIAAVATAYFPTDISSFQTQFGVAVGYGASQSALRALAMNRPNDDGTPGIKPFEQWSQVRVDVERWTQAFGYPVNNQQGRNDPSDLARELWEGNFWTNPALDNDRAAPGNSRANSFDKTYNVLYAFFENELLAEEGRPLPSYGIRPLVSGEALNCRGLGIAHGMGQAIFFATGNDFHIESLDFGVELDVDTLAVLCPSRPTGRSFNEGRLLHADWVSMTYNRDDEFLVRSENVDVNILDGYIGLQNVDLIFLIGTKPGFDRVEGGISAPNVTLPWLETFVTARVQPAVFVFGSGDFDGSDLHFLGLQGTAYVAGYGLGGAALFGRIDPNSQVLHEAGFAELMEKFLQEGRDGVTTTYDGAYVMVRGAIPILSTDVCVLNLGLAGEVRVWHFMPEDVTLASTWGGGIDAAGYGTLLCVFHQRVQMGLTFERVSGVSHGGIQCADPQAGCYGMTGEVWMANGIGFCSPETWATWPSRWWDDGWCWTYGAWAQMSYLDTGMIGLAVEADAELVPGELHFDTQVDVSSLLPTTIGFERPVEEPGGEPGEEGAETSLFFATFLPVIAK